MALKVGELFVLFSLDTSGVNRGLDNVDYKLQQLSSQFTQYGMLWKRSITDPIVNFGKDAVKTSREVQGEMAKTYAKTFTSDMAPEEVTEATERLNEEMERVAKDSVFTSKEVAGAYDKMAMAGWRWESMVGGLEPIMDLAAASGEDVVTVSDIVTDAMTAFGLTFESAGEDINVFQQMVQHFTDVLATAATSSNTDVAKMGESFKYAATMAGTMGYEIDDIAVALGLMANRGTKASQAGTSLRRMLQVLAAPNDKQGFIMDTLGISLTDAEGKAYSFKELMNELRDTFSGLDLDAEGYADAVAELTEQYEAAVAAGEEWERLGAHQEENGAWYNTEESKKYKKEHSQRIKEYQEYLDQLEQLNKQYIDTQVNGSANLEKVAYASDLFGARGMLSLLAIVQASDEEYNSLIDSIYGSEGRTHEMKETMLDNAQGSLDMFLSSVDVLKKEIGDLANETLTPMIDKAKELVDNFIGLDDETKKSIMDIAGVAAAIGPLLIGMGLLTKLLPALSGAFSFLASPMGIVTGLLAAMAISALDTEGKLGKAFEGIGDILGMDVSGFSLEDIDITGMLDGLLGDIGSLAENPAVTGFMERLGQGLIGALGSLGDICGQIISYILSPEGLSAIWDAGQAIGNLLMNALQSVLGGIVSFFTSLIDRVLINWGLINEEDYKQYEADLNQSVEISDQIKDGFKGAVEDLDNDDNMKQAMMMALFGDMEDFGTEELVKFLDKADEIIAQNGSWDSFESVRQQMYDALRFAIMDVNFDAGEEFTGEQVKSIVEPYLKMLNIATDMLTDEAYQALADSYSGGVGDNNKFLMTLFGYLLNPDGIEEQTEEAVEDVKEKAIEEVQEMVKNITDETGEVPKGMETALTDEKDKVGTAAAEVSDEAVKQFLLTMSEENGKTIAVTYTGGIIAGLESAEIKETISKIAQEAVDAIRGLFTYDEGYTIGSTFGGAIVSGISSALAMVANLKIPKPGGGLTAGAGSDTVTGTGENGDITSAIKDGMNGMGVYLDREKVGEMVADDVSYSIGRESNLRE